MSDERRLVEQIRVGHTIFQPGVKLSLVLDRIERGLTYGLAHGPDEVRTYGGVATKLAEVYGQPSSESESLRG